MSASLDAELEVARRLAVEAGAKSLGFAGRLSAPRYKEHGELVSEADEQIDAYLRDGLTKAFPCDGILSEETKDDLTRLSEKRVWIVDPIDGSQVLVNYCRAGSEKGKRANDTFSVMIGLSVDHAARLGVVHLPARNETFYATAGRYGWIETGGETIRLRVSSRDDMGAMRLVVSNQVRRDKELLRAYQSFPSKEKRIAQGLGYKICSIASGYNDAYFSLHPRAREWDLCASKAILEEAGGILTDVDGGSISFNRSEIGFGNGLVASNGKVHKEILRYLADHR